MTRQPKKSQRTNEEDQARAEEDQRHRAWEDFVCLCGDYANHILTPRILAERRRRAGDPSASPTDYDCRCELKSEDELPICEGRRPNCKFAHRKRPDGPHYTDDKPWFRTHQAERERIVASLPAMSNEAMLAELRRMDAEIEKESARLLRVRGHGIKRALTAWMA